MKIDYDKPCNELKCSECVLHDICVKKSDKEISIRQFVELVKSVKLPQVYKQRKYLVKVKTKFLNFPFEKKHFLVNDLKGVWVDRVFHNNNYWYCENVKVIERKNQRVIYNGKSKEDYLKAVRNELLSLQ